MSHLLVPKHFLGHAHVYDEFGRMLPVITVLQHYNELLGDKVKALVAESVKHADDPNHQSHADLAEATHARLSGLWHIERYAAEIEWYAERFDSSVKGLDFHQMPLHVQAAADAAMKKDKKPEVTDFAETFENLFLTAGVTMLWNQAEGAAPASNTGASPAVTNAYLNNAQARIGVGDSSTAASAGQTGLQAATNKSYVGMDATYPTISTNSTTFRATFGTSVANYSWNEFVIDNGNGSNSTSTTLSGGTTLDRVVSAQGSKASGQTWQPSMVLSVS